MATNDVYLRPDAGDGANGVRLRPDGPDSGGAAPFFVAALGVLSAVSVLALGSVFTPPNLALGSAPAGTTVLRGPTYQQHKAPPQVFALQPPNLLTSTLSVAAAPAPFVPFQPAGLQRALWQPDDSSAGVPKGLIPDAQAPVGESPAFAPIALVRNVVDTSQKQPITLQVIVVPPPIVNPPQHAPLRALWQPDDSSSSVPTGLLPQATAPVGGAPAFAPVALVRNVVDTSQLQPITLQTVADPAPNVNAPHIAPARALWQPADTSQETQRTLDIAAPIPPGGASWVGLQRAWFHPADSSQDSFAIFYPPAAILPPPPGQVAFVGAPRLLWQPGDTTLESPPVAIQNVQPLPPAPPVAVDGGGGRFKWWRYRFPDLTFGDKLTKKKREQIAAAELEVAEALAQGWERTASEVDATVTRILRDQGLAIAARERTNFAQSLRIAQEMERRQRATDLQAAEQEREQARLRRNRLLVALLIASDN